MVKLHSWLHSTFKELSNRISIEPSEAMSQQEELCLNKDQVELKSEDKTLS